MLYTLIGVSPPPITLPATNRSIIIPCACHRHHWEQPNFRHISISRSLLFGRSWRTYEHGLRHRLSTGKVPEDLVFNFQRLMKKQITAVNENMFIWTNDLYGIIFLQV